MRKQRNSELVELWSGRIPLPVSDVAVCTLAQAQLKQDPNLAVFEIQENQGWRHRAESLWAQEKASALLLESERRREGEMGSAAAF